MKYFTIKRNLLSNKYKATEVSRLEYMDHEGFVITCPDNEPLRPRLAHHNQRLVVVDF